VLPHEHPPFAVDPVIATLPADFRARSKPLISTSASQPQPQSNTLSTMPLRKGWSNGRSSGTQANPKQEKTLTIRLERFDVRQ
jgi:hypothetical protein